MFKCLMCIFYYHFTIPAATRGRLVCFAVEYLEETGRTCKLLWKWKNNNNGLHLLLFFQGTQSTLFSIIPYKAFLDHQIHQNEEMTAVQDNPACGLIYTAIFTAILFGAVVLLLVYSLKDDWLQSVFQL